MVHHHVQHRHDVLARRGQRLREKARGRSGFAEHERKRIKSVQGEERELAKSEKLQAEPRETVCLLVHAADEVLQLLSCAL